MRERMMKMSACAIAGSKMTLPTGMPAFRRTLCVALAVSALTPCVAAAQAAPDAAPVGQDAGLEDIVVTATKTGETRAQSTPLAITVVSSDRLAASGIANVRDIV